MGKTRVRCGDYYFDAVLRLDHNRKNVITSHPVEEGANIADHAYLEPKELTLEVGMSDAAYTKSESFTGANRSVNAYTALCQLMEAQKPFPVVTRLFTYQNMLIESISSPEDYTTVNGLRATIFLRELPLVKTHTVQVSVRTTADAHKIAQANTSTSTKQPVTTNSASPTHQSVLKQAVGKLKG